MRSTIMTAVLGFCVLATIGVRVMSAQQTQTPPPAGRAGGRGQGPGEPTNLKVLPKDTTGPQVIAIMRTFVSGTGLQCGDCHVSQQDHASDDKPLKGVARRMLQMEMAINDQYLKDIGDPPPPGAQKVTCYTCHRGTRRPLTTAPAGGGH